MQLQVVTGSDASEANGSLRILPTNRLKLRFAFDFPTHCTHKPAKQSKPIMAPTIREQVQQSIP